MIAATTLFGQIEHNDPLDLNVWERFRNATPHPRCMMTGADVQHTRNLIKTERWAAQYAQSKVLAADKVLADLTDAKLEQFIEITTPMGFFYPCPACRAKGLPWHPNGTWGWNANDPDHIYCNTCKTVFPHPDFPEDIVIQSKWDPRQKITFVGGEPFPVYGVITRPSLLGMIRTRKLQFSLTWLDMLADAYIYSGEAKYAEGVKRLMLRYATVLPKYLFGVNIYSEFADCDPHIAAKDPFKLPTDEITAPPNRPDRRIHSGYWQGNRMGSAGMDGSIGVRLANAYDLTCTAKRADGNPVYTEEECKHIEKDVLIELAYHFVYDKSINNKSVGNRTGAAAIGLAAGQPDMVRFGLDGFLRTVNNWFLPDGSTSESASYGLMTMGCIQSFSYLFRDYSDPEGYVAPEGSPRLTHFNVCRDTDYGTCWQNMILTLQGDMAYPPIADTYKNSRISTAFADMLAICLPNRFNLSFLKASNGGKISNRRTALTYGDAPSLDGVPEFSLPDIVFPYLAQGYLRTGENGKGATAVLNASNWGGHHHKDSLDLVLWQEDELLSDLGYLWDHQDKHQTYRTFAHNLVVIDDKDQTTTDRGGSFDLFETVGGVKAMRASSKAYPEAKAYERTLLQIEHNDGSFYWLDLFRAQGGSMRDYVFHGPNNNYSLQNIEFKEPLSVNNENLEKQRFIVLLHVDKLDTIEISDPEVFEIDELNKPLGENMAKPFVTDIPVGEPRHGDDWGIYRGNGTCAWEACEGKKTRGIKYSALTHDKSGIINHAFVIGGGNGFVAPNGFIGKRNASYCVRFWARGNNRLRIKAVCYDIGKEKDPGARRHVNGFLKEVEVTPEWKLFEGKITFGLPTHGIKIAQRFVGKPSADFWSGTWTIKDNLKFTAMAPINKQETILFADEWGQRDWRNSDRGATLPYFMRRRTGNQLDEYITLFQTHREEPAVKGLKVIENDNGIVVLVDTTTGQDTILFAKEGKRLEYGSYATDAQIAVSVAGQNAAIFYGTTLETGSISLKCNKKAYGGKEITAVNEKYDAYFLLKGDTPDIGTGHTLIVWDDKGVSHAYPILKTAKADGGLRAYVKVDGYGFPAREGVAWQLPAVASIKQQ